MEAFVHGVYRDLDQDIDEELARLAEDDLFTLPCRKGCFHCCRQTIPASQPEAHTMGQYIKRTFSPAALAALRDRIDEWLRWEREELPAFVEPGITDVNAAVHMYGPPCPLLLNGECSTYPVRPVACRAHYVTSDPGRCMPHTSPEALDGSPEVVKSVHLVATVHAALIRRYTEADNAEPLSLLVHGVATELG